jgi:hypothetical protein
MPSLFADKASRAVAQETNRDIGAMNAVLANLLELPTLDNEVLARVPARENELIADLGKGGETPDGTRVESAIETLAEDNQMK